MNSDISSSLNNDDSCKASEFRPDKVLDACLAVVFCLAASLVAWFCARGMVLGALSGFGCTFDWSIDLLFLVSALGGSATCCLTKGFSLSVMGIFRLVLAAASAVFVVLALALYAAALE